jgi:phage baseplate assembly protein W
MAEQEPAQAVRRRLLGRGLACRRLDPTLDVGRDLELAAGPNGLDLATVEGMDNLLQCLEVALTTALGSDVFATDFGFDGVNALVEEANPLLVRERVRVSIVQLLGRDPRIRRIVDLKLVDRRLELSAPPDGEDDPATRLDRWRSVRVDVAFETVAGDEALINLGRVLPRV